MSGELVVVGTPIGNLGDIAPRAVEALRAAEMILCEDTRRTRELLSALSIPATGRLSALHDHNERVRCDEVVGAIASGRTVVLVSDAGMPGISDPGSVLVAAVVDDGGSVTVIPGPSAVLAALVVSGLPTDRFCMEGFLPRRGKDRRAALEALATEERTSVLFESPRRLAATLAEFATALGADRRVVIARELTKLHEEIWRGSLEAAAQHWSEVEARGEVVIVLGGAAPPAIVEISDTDIIERLHQTLAAGRSKRDAIDQVAAELGVVRRRVYELAIALASA